MSFDAILGMARQYYDDKLETYGATHKGVDWNSAESQELRFQQLLRICEHDQAFSMNDYGCGYGALIDYMIARGYKPQYCGFDISARMIAQAQELHQGLDGCRFFADESLLSQADYTVCSGIFNVRLQTSDEEWQEYVLHTLSKIAEQSARGFAFNILTGYSDREYMRPDLYYADPLFYFDYCKTRFSKYVALLHDYPLYEFTVLVRK